MKNLNLKHSVMSQSYLVPYKWSFEFHGGNYGFCIRRLFERMRG